LEGKWQKFITGRDLPPLFFETEVKYTIDGINSALP